MLREQQKRSTSSDEQHTIEITLMVLKVSFTGKPRATLNLHELRAVIQQTLGQQTDRRTRCTQ